MAPIERIASLLDPRIVDYRDIRDADLLGRKGLFMAEGRLVVWTLLADSRFRARSVLLSDAAWEAMREAILSLDAPPPVYVAPQDIVSAVAGFHVHRGCLAVGERGEMMSPATALSSVAPGPALVVALEGLSNHDNVGAIFRNAAAFGAGAVLLDHRSCDPLYRKAIRVSMGAALRTPFARAADAAELLKELSASGFSTVALATSAVMTIDELANAPARPARIALLLGAEGPGLTDATLAAADHTVRIPMAPGTDSLNVATAAAIAMHRLSTVQ